MNSIVLMAELLTEPESRRTPDNQSTIASFLVQFAGNRSEEAPFRLKVVGWNTLADEIMEKYHKGDQVVIEGRLRLDTVDRGTYKEKRTELVAQRIHSFGAASISNVSTFSATARSADVPRAEPLPRSEYANNVNNVVPMPTAYVPTASPVSDPDYDDIPF
ncbi:MAG: single-stranded DNA-binding protein [Pseudanabaenaceae cyanobacterium bins.39]|nr:single-stranded DNA-binding protein [Pseudanabaenaceae cyanobacterium bins.39]